ncbi:hypothetical protein Hsw_3477 [Hymenobacter swuensis DY53]|uniref:Uncharacterized protein n=1 Tax=Hymenobacter swuensis DY53 TaxID=1227739 RepID=W8F4W7_9BACT|nr:hypothetical protein Hsw_3477 [Hymenobacter swuensis DY53]
MLFRPDYYRCQHHRQHFRKPTEVQKNHSLGVALFVDNQVN